MHTQKLIWSEKEYPAKRNLGHKKFRRINHDVTKDDQTYFIKCNGLNCN